MDLRHHTVSSQRRPPSQSDTTRQGTGASLWLVCIQERLKMENIPFLVLNVPYSSHFLSFFSPVEQLRTVNPENSPEKHI